MSLLSDLQNLNLSGILDARADIRVSVDAPEIQQILTSGAAQAALGDLGTTLTTLREAGDNPQALLSAVLGALGNLAEALDSINLPIDDYITTVRQGAEILANLLAGLSGDPSRLGDALGRGLGATVGAVSDAVSRYAFPELDEFGRFKSLVETIEGGLPTDPAAFAGLALDALLPFPRNNLLQVRGGLQTVVGGLAEIRLPTERTSGLTLALNGVATAAAGGNVAAVNRALAELARVRENTLASLQQDVLRLVARLDSINLNPVLDTFETASRTLNAGTEGILEFMEYLRAQVASLRERIGELNTQQIRDFLPQIMTFLEVKFQELVVQPVEQQVQRLEEWVRGLLRQLPLRDLRGELSRFIIGIAQTIRDADIDRYAREVLTLLEDLRQTVGSVNLGGQIQGVLSDIQTRLMSALDGIFSALQSIKAAVDAVAGQAVSVLQRASAALAGFRQTIDSITAQIANLDIDGAAQQAIDQLRSLRETAEELLTAAPLPEPLRPLVDQLVETLRNADFDVVLEPVRQAADELKIPPEVGNTIRAGLEKVVEVLNNLVPQSLIEDIQREIGAALDTIRNFNPADLLSGVTDALSEATAFIGNLQIPAELTATIRQPFEAVLGVVDQVRPSRLLAPVIEAYEDLLGNINLPAPEAAVTGVSQVVGTAGNAIGETVGAPLTQLAPQGAATAGSGSGTASGSSPAPTFELTPPADFSPGDIIRVFAYVPQKLRQALAALNASAAGDVMRGVDDLTGALARDIRGFNGLLWATRDRLAADLDLLLLPLGEAQLAAQLALTANFSVGAGGATLDLEASLDAVALAGPASLRQNFREVTGVVDARLGGMLGTGSRGSAALERIADALERSRLANLSGSLDNLLAALDPEPLAAELDALFTTILQRTPPLMTELIGEFEAFLERLKNLWREFNPGAQAQKFLRILLILREELELLSPRRLAEELDEIHGAIRESVAAYDPALLVQSLNAIILEIGNALGALNPATLLGDLTIFDDVADRLAEVNPVTALAGIGTALTDVGNELRALNPQELLDAVNGLAPQVVEAFELALNGIRDEIVALLEALRFAGASVEASASVSVG